MRFLISVLYVVVVVLVLTPLPSAHAGRIPEELDNRLAEMNKWFEARIPIYQKANYLLKKLGSEVGKLSHMHNGIDFYYNGWSDQDYFSSSGRNTPHLRVLKVSDNNSDDLKSVEETVRKALETRTVKNILQLSPEIKSAFKKVMHNKV